jgi:pseudoazurin
MLSMKTIMSGAILAGLMNINSALAEDHTVTANALAYEPMVLNIAPGDTVYWTNMSTHNVHMIEGLIPEGAEAFSSAMGESVTKTFDKEGIYIYQCDPHIGAGMGGALIVGNPNNLDAIESQKVKGGLGRVVKKAIKAAKKM